MLLLLQSIDCIVAGLLIFPVCKLDRHTVVNPLRVLGANLAGAAALAGQIAGQLGEAGCKYSILVAFGQEPLVELFVQPPRQLCQLAQLCLCTASHLPLHSSAPLCSGMGHRICNERTNTSKKT